VLLGVRVVTSQTRGEQLVRQQRRGKRAKRELKRGRVTQQVEKSREDHETPVSELKSESWRVGRLAPWEGNAILTTPLMVDDALNLTQRIERAKGLRWERVL
jgi:hypothetical protein